MIDTRHDRERRLNIRNCGQINYILTPNISLNQDRIYLLTKINILYCKFKIHKMDVSFEVQAFSKVILHATKYPEYSVNGVLLSKRDKKEKNTSSDSSSVAGTTPGKLTFYDCIPLLHMSKYVTPSMEVALAQVRNISLVFAYYN